jgi:1,2-diacylglycerol 3-beta-galactosyltransferase
MVSAINNIIQVKSVTAMLDYKKKKVLVLTADAGFGHRSAANAVCAALEERYGDQCEITIRNPMEDKRTPFFLRDSQTDYDKIVRAVPELYKMGYDASDAQVPSAIVESALTVMLFEVMREVINTTQPDVIVITYPIYQSALNAVFTVERRYVPTVTVVTDLVTIHRLWFNKTIDKLLVPNAYVQDLAMAYNMPRDKVQITGIPVNPEIVREKRSAEEIRSAQGWSTDLPTFLAIGSKRVDHLLDALNVLNHFGLPLQLIVAAGNDEDLYRQLHEMEWHVPVHLYKFVSNMPTFMHAADAVICKAGGLVVTEALASSKPILLVDAIPGQETGNAEYVVNGGAGDLALSPLEVLETMAHWMKNDRKLMKERAVNARRLGRPDAAYKVAELAWQLANKGPVDKHGKRLAGRKGLIDLLRQNQVPVRFDLLNDRNKTNLDDGSV